MANHDDTLPTSDPQPLPENPLEPPVPAHQSSPSSSSSSSSSESDEDQKPQAPATAKVFRLFGREKPVHHVLGGSKAADVLLWRNKKISGTLLGAATAIWVLFELVEYHLLTLVCHCLVALFVILFLWSSATTSLNRAPPRIPELLISEDSARNAALALRFEINFAISVLRDIAGGRDLQKFLAVTAGLWVLSVLGNSVNFLTLFYIVIVLLHTVPVLYEKYEDKVDPCLEKAVQQISRHYAVLEAKVLSKIPKGPLKEKKLS